MYQNYVHYDQNVNIPTQRPTPHETIELHELLAFKTVGLYKMKRTIAEINDPELRQLYRQSIQVTERDIQEIISLLQYRPVLG